MAVLPTTQHSATISQPCYLDVPISLTGISLKQGRTEKYASKLTDQTMSQGAASRVDSPLEWSIASGLPGEHASLDDFQQALFDAIWGLEASIRLGVSPLTKYYLAQVNLIDPHKLPVITHRDVVEIVEFVRNRKSLTRDRIRDDLRSSRPRWLGPSPVSADIAIDLAVRLWLLCDPVVFQADDCIIVDQLDQHFSRIGGRALFEEFEPQFDAAFFERVAGVTIMGTQRLTNHLRYDRKHKVLSVFDVPDFLSCNRSQEELNLFPPGLLLETQKSLALLFPQGRAYPNDAVPRRPHPDIEMAAFGQFPDLQRPDSYIYWRERLTILHGVYSKAHPSKLMEFWRDRRNANQWTMLWLAVLVIFLTLVFGLIQSITGILQVIIAYRQSRRQ